jgi:hypothetical protein
MTTDFSEVKMTSPSVAPGHQSRVSGDRHRGLEAVCRFSPPHGSSIWVVKSVYSRAVRYLYFRLFPFTFILVTFFFLF